MVAPDSHATPHSSHPHGRIGSAAGARHAPCLGILGCRMHHGEWRELIGPSGFGPDRFRLLQVIQENPGTGMRREDLAKLNGLWHMGGKDIFSQAICVLRRAHGDSTSGFLIRTQRIMGEWWVSWPAARRWIRVELLLPAQHSATVSGNMPGSDRTHAPQIDQNNGIAKPQQGSGSTGDARGSSRGPGQAPPLAPQAVRRLSAQAQPSHDSLG